MRALSCTNEENGRLNSGWSMRRGFTLVELMISIALALLLLLGVNAVFNAASQTTGTGLAFSGMTRDLRGLERSFQRDFASAVPMKEMPVLVIMSQSQLAYSNFEDETNDNSGGDGKIETVDIDGDGAEDALNFGEYAYRNHRIDRIFFFARNTSEPFRRQTGNQPVGGKAEIITQDGSREAMIWYGHLNLPKKEEANPNPDADYYAPGFDAPGNTGNRYANDWHLGRMAVLMREFDSSEPDNRVAYDPSTFPFTPLGKRSRARSASVAADAGAGGGDWSIWHSRFDIADTTISQFREDISGYDYNVSPPWWQHFNYRFNAKPVPNRAVTQAARRVAEAALTVPLLQKGVSQFIVEYAGDYFIQENDPTSNQYGEYLGDGQDGVIDYIAPQGRGSSRTIRWYGMPRNSDLSNDTAGPYVPGGANSPDVLTDVVPQRVVQRVHKGSKNPQLCQFENLESWMSASANFVKTMPQNASYVAAWTPEDLENGLGPKMIRIVMTMKDGNGRLGEGQTVEYVFNMPQ